MKRILLLVIILSLVFSCNQYENYCSINLEQVVKYQITATKKDRKPPFLVEQFFIPMETMKEYLLGEIKRIITHQDYIFIADNQKVICYELDKELSRGEIRYGINKLGKGPGEYYKIEDISVNNQFLFIYDLRKVNCYEINTGKFVKSIGLNFAAREISAMNNHLVFYASSFQNQPKYNYEIIVVSLNKKKQYKYFKNRDKYLGSTEGYHLYKSENDLFYSSPFRNIVYKFDENIKPQPIVVLETNSENTIFDLTSENAINNPEDLKNGNYYYYFINMLRIKDYWVFQYCHKGNFSVVWCNIQNQNTFIESPTFLPQTVYKDYIISPVDSWYIAKFNPVLFKKDKEALKMYSRVMNVNESDNPCLLLKKIIYE